MKLMKRDEVAQRWGTSVRTIDRRRLSGELVWIDLACGKGKRPIVRFDLADVVAFENRMRLNIADKERGVSKDPSRSRI